MIKKAIRNIMKNLPYNTAKTYVGVTSQSGCQIHFPLRSQILTGEDLDAALKQRDAYQKLIKGI